MKTAITNDAVAGTGILEQSTSIYFLLYCFVYRCAECPPAFTYNWTVNGCYKVVTRNLEWSVAGLECRTLHEDAHLVVINNANEQAAIDGLIQSLDR